MPSEQRDKVDKILGDLLNITKEYAEETIIGSSCPVCGFPLDKKVREEKVKEAHAKINTLYAQKYERERLSKEEIVKAMDSQKYYLESIGEKAEYDLGEILCGKDIDIIATALFNVQTEKMK